MQNLKILWIAGSAIVGGAERVTLQLAELLTRRGHQIAVIYPFGSDLAAALHATGIPGDAQNLGGSLNFRAIGAIERAICVRKPDIALVTTADEWVWSCLARRRSVPTQLVLARHMAIPLPRKVIWLAARRADAIIAVSAAVRASLSSRCGIPPARLHMVPNPVRLPIRSSVPSEKIRREARTAMGLSEIGHWIGFFGGAEPRKGLGDLLQATAKIHAEGFDCNLIVCGRGLKGAFEMSLAQLAEHYSLQGRIHNLGEISDVATAMLACDAIAMPTHSTLSEGLPLVVLEALACGTPVIAYATGGANEALADGAGLLARPDDPGDLARLLMRLFIESGLAGTIAERGLQRARIQYAPDLAADRYEALFLELRNTSSRAR